MSRLALILLGLGVVRTALLPSRFRRVACSSEALQRSGARAGRWAATLGVLLASLAAASPEDPHLGRLSPEHRRWLDEVGVLITEAERQSFLGLDREFRRRAFIEAFWEERDPDPVTAANELRLVWERRLEEVQSLLGTIDPLDERVRVYLLNGEPLNRCTAWANHLEIWAYLDHVHVRDLEPGSRAWSQVGERIVGRFDEGVFDNREPLLLIFQKRGVAAAYTLWSIGSLRPVSREDRPQRSLRGSCSDEMVLSAKATIAKTDDYAIRCERLLRPPDPPSEEWVPTFADRSGAPPPGAETFDADLTWGYRGRHQSRTVLQGVVTVARDAVETLEIGGRPTYHLLLTGEVERDEHLLERFRYRFELPADTVPGEGIPLVFQRYLRPGTATLHLKLEDRIGRRFAGFERRIEVPRAEAIAEVPGLEDSELYRFLAEADAATVRGERILRLVPPEEIVQTGLVRFQTLAVGDIAKATFFLDGKPILSKNRPPFSVELDLGDVPAPHRLRVAAYDGEGGEVVADEIIINPGGQRFRVRLVEPRPGRRYERSVRAVAQVEIPDGEALERLELFLDERRVATLYQEPFVQPILLDGAAGGIAYVRVVAYLRDGHSTEDVVLLNAPDVVEEIDVQMVEVYAAVEDRRGRPVAGLPREVFEVYEDGHRQPLRRFEWVVDLPIHAALLLDTSASMEDSLPRVAEAAATFVEQTIRPQDRVALVAFDDRPEVRVRFTGGGEAVRRSLATLDAAGGTALYDSLVFALHYFHGIKGQRALLLLSDGEDESSTFDVDGALAYAQRAGVTVYAVGLREAAQEKAARRVLTRLAEETGGRSFFIERLEELPAIYDAIEEELRSQYFLAYQSSSRKDPSEFRRVEVKVLRDGLEARSMSGYYP